MKKTKMSKTMFRVLVLPVAFAFAGTGIAHAQQDEERVMIQLNIMEIKADKVDQFRAIHRDSFIPAARGRGMAWRQTSRVILGNTLQFSVATPIPNMAALANSNSPGATPTESALALDLWEQTIQSRRSIVITSRPDLSMAQVPATGLTTVVHFLVQPGKSNAFAAYMTDMVLPALRASGVVGARMFETTMGGPSGEFWMLVPQAGFAAMDGPGPFSSVDPQRGAEMNTIANGLFISWDTSLSGIDRELSYGLPGLQQ